MADALSREPRVSPAMLAEVFSRPASPAVQSLARYAVPRMFGTLGAWFAAEVQAGHIRDQPVLALAHQLVGPIMMHMLMRPAFPDVPEFALPDIDDVCKAFAANFIRAVGTPATTKRAVSR